MPSRRLHAALCPCITAVPMQHTRTPARGHPAPPEIDVLAAAGTHACVIFGDSTVANELPRLLAARACAPMALKT